MTLTECKAMCESQVHCIFIFHNENTGDCDLFAECTADKLEPGAGGYVYAYNYRCRWDGQWMPPENCTCVPVRDDLWDDSAARYMGSHGAQCREHAAKSVCYVEGGCKYKF